PSTTLHGRRRAQPFRCPVGGAPCSAFRPSGGGHHLDGRRVVATRRSRLARPTGRSARLSVPCPFVSGDLFGNIERIARRISDKVSPQTFATTLRPPRPPRIRRSSRGRRPHRAHADRAGRPTIDRPYPARRPVIVNPPATGFSTAKSLVHLRFRETHPSTWGGTKPFEACGTSTQSP